MFLDHLHDTQPPIHVKSEQGKNYIYIYFVLSMTAHTSTFQFHFFLFDALHCANGGEYTRLGFRDFIFKGI